MSIPLHADHIHGFFDAGDSAALHRIFSKARQAITDRIGIDDEVDRRLAVIVLFTYGAEAKASRVPAEDEGAIARICADRFLARTSVV